MIRLARHIEILLLGNECVIVPNLGGFVVHHKEARYDLSDGMFLPPLRTLGFNPLLKMNDSLLVQSYVEAYDLSYPEALDAIEDEVREVLKIMGTTGSYEFNSLGRLYYDKDGHMNFEPCESGILTPEFYALSSFEMPLLPAVAKADETADDEEQKAEHKPRVIYIGKEFGQKTLNISLRAIRNVSVAAAIIAAVFLVTFPLSKNAGGITRGNIESGFYEMFFPKTDAGKDKVVEPISNEKAKTAQAPQAEKKLEKANESEETSDDAIPASESLSTADETAPVKPHWSIVVCSHVTKKNAEALIEKLEKQGINGLTLNTVGATKVLYGNYATKEDAHKKLNELNDNAAFKDAWLLEIKE